jgi:hypothetical protein
MVGGEEGCAAPIAAGEMEGWRRRRRAGRERAAAAESGEGEGGGGEQGGGEQARGAAGEGSEVRVLGVGSWGWGGGIRWDGRVVGGRFRKSVSGGSCKTTRTSTFCLFMWK